MLTILILAIIGILIGCYLTYIEEWYNEVSIYIVHSSLGAVLGAIVGAVIAFILPMDTYTKKYSYNIETIKDNLTSKGSFFLGSGHIDGEMKYMFYYEENGFYRMSQLSYNKASIMYTNDTPKVTVSELSITNATINLFALDCGIGNKSYVIQIPKGSIQHNFTLNAE